MKSATSSAGENADARDQAAFDAATKQIRGSAALFAGRPIALVLNLLTQVLTVRYLTKLDFGAFIFAFAMMETAIVFSGFGMNKALARFASIYDEQDDRRRLAGVVGVAMLGVVGVGCALILFVYGLAPLLVGAEVLSPLSTSLLLTLILLAPIKALDNVNESLTSAFAGARLLFLRRVLLIPLLRLTAVLVVIAASGDVMALAVSHVLAGIAGTVLYGLLLWKAIRTRRVLQPLSASAMASTCREFVRYSATLFSSDLTLLLRGVLVVVFLQFLHSTASVAEYRAVLPLAGLSELVMISFSVLYIPIAARIFANRQPEKLHQLYWQTASWITVLTFPLFAISYAIADPVVTLLFGQEYAGSGSVLALLALAYYFNASMGFNSRTLKVVGKVREILIVDLLALGVAGLAYAYAIPRHGAVGAAAAVSLSTAFHAVAKQVALFRWTSVRRCQWRFTKLYLAVAIATVVLTAWRWVGPTTLTPSLALVVVCWLAVIFAGREALAVHQHFPELQRMRFLRRWLQTS